MSKPQTQEEIFKELMVLLAIAILEDFGNGTGNHESLFDRTMQACLVSGIPPEHQVAVMRALTQLVTTLNVEYAKIARRGISPN